MAEARGFTALFGKSVLFCIGSKLVNDTGEDDQVERGEKGEMEEVFQKAFRVYILVLHGFYVSLVDINANELSARHQFAHTSSEDTGAKADFKDPWVLDLF